MKKTVEAVEIMGDSHTKEGVEQKALEFGLSLLDGGRVHLERHKGAELFVNWLVHCGIPYKVVERELQTYQGKFPERIAHALSIGTFGRKAHGIDGLLHWY